MTIQYKVSLLNLLKVNVLHGHLKASERVENSTSSNETLTINATTTICQDSYKNELSSHWNYAPFVAYLNSIQGLELTDSIESLANKFHQFVRDDCLANGLTKSITKIEIVRSNLNTDLDIKIEINNTKT